jgi:membrane protease YdiL (CAAX protease family)
MTGPGNKPGFWQLFSILWVAGMVGAAAGFPYLMSIARLRLQGTALRPFRLLLPYLGQMAILVGIAVAVGVRLGRGVGLTTPLVESYLSGNVVANARRSAVAGVTVGIVVALLITLLESVLFQRFVSVPTLDLPAWQRALAALYGGLTEEILGRFFLMTLVAWIMSLHKERPVGGGVLFLANLVAAVVFAFGHLPVTRVLTTVSGVVIARTLALNGIAGVVFGVLFKRYGLESAMIAHSVSDLILLFVPAYVLR